MKVIAVRQPWALHIVQSGKDIENRSSNIAGAYRGLVAIHASKRPDEEALRALPALPPNGIPRVFHYGAIIGVAELVDVHPGWIEGTPCTPWGIRYVNHVGQHHLVLRDARPLRTPIPHRGALGLRDLPTDIEHLIRKELDQ